jgi:hypothetical protein
VLRIVDFVLGPSHELVERRDSRESSLIDRLLGHRFEEYSAKLAHRFGSSPGRRVDGRIFAMLVGGELVVKLPRQRVDELVEAGTGRWFDAGKGRPMREWASIGVAEAGAWPKLIAEAYEFVGSIGPAGGA